MRAWIRRALCAVGLTGGLLLLGLGLAETASAEDTGPVTTGESGILSGNQSDVDVQALVNASGNQVTVIGQDNEVQSVGGSSTAGGSGGTGSPTTSGQDGLGSGNQTDVDVLAPVNVSGNQVTVIGQDNEVQSVGGSSTAGGSGGTGSPTTSGQDGLASGNQTDVDVLAPVNVSGNQVTVIGQDNRAQSASGSTAPSSEPGSDLGSTTGQGGLLSGNQTALGVILPVNVSGNQVTVIGQDNEVSSLGGATAGPGTTGPGTTGSTAGPTTSGEDAIGSGNQTGVGVLVPIAATGNQVTVIGQDNTLTSVGGATTPTGSTGPGQTTTGEGGIGSGNQTPVTVQVPVDGSGNQVTVVGQDNTLTSTGGSSTGGTPGGGPTTPPGTDVSPPTGGDATPEGPQGSSTPGTTVLPSTGMAGGLLRTGLLGLLLLLVGLGLSRREGVERCTS